jgi:hypothetical protein
MLLRTTHFCRVNSPSASFFSNLHVRQPVLGALKQPLRVPIFLRSRLLGGSVARPFPLAASSGGSLSVRACTECGVFENGHQGEMM